MYDAVIAQLNDWIYQFTQLWPEDHFFHEPWNVKGPIAMVLVCLVCGAMGTLVVGNRMSFFSDALAHCAFAGVALGFLLFLVAGSTADVFRERLTYVMVLFGISIGVLIAFVREKTGLASDTVIGVFYAGAIGIGALFTRLLARNRLLDIEFFIFGNPSKAQTAEILLLALLTLLVAGVFARMYNGFILVSVNPSLARSRRVAVRFNQYVLIVMLGLLVNLSLQIVGTLLINGLLIVPAAAAANLARNVRQMFWYSIAVALACGLGGYFLSWEVSTNFPGQEIGISGTVVVLCVLVFIVSALVGGRLRNRPAAPAAA